MPDIGLIIAILGVVILLATIGLQMVGGIGTIFSFMNKQETISLEELNGEQKNDQNILSVPPTNLDDDIEEEESIFVSAKPNRDTRRDRS